MAPRTQPLTRLFRGERDDRGASAAPLAFGRSGSRDRKQLLAHAGALAHAVDLAGAGHWLVFVEDGYAAAVTLAAMAQTGSVAVLAPNRQAETLRELRDDCVGTISELDLTAAIGETGPYLSPLASEASDWRFRAVDREAPLAEFRTSGTTGERKEVTKRLRHLEDEVETLEAVFGDEIPAGSAAFGTVSHQHIYGLLFRVLWPLATGRPFQTETLLHPQEILPRMAEREDTVLVSSPVHLRRMQGQAELARAAEHCRAVFSSGGLLDAETAHGVAAALGQSPFEILGSTETGGVAFRQRSRHSESWSALPGVEIDTDDDEQRLVVTSPFASEGEAVDATRCRFSMGDRIERLADGGFVLLGRADRIVKIGEKRLSLPAMELDLEAHPRVSEAALVVLPRAGDERVHAVVALDPEGREQLRSGGRRVLGAALSAHLAAKWDRVLVPRQWRYVDELPRDAQGKLPRTALAALFESQRREPLVREEDRGDDHIERRLEVPDDLVFLQGHFDAFPVVAGVVQLRWVRDAARALLGHDRDVAALEAVKFPEPLLPGQILSLRVDAEPDRLRFRLWDGEHTFASGRWILGASS